jgi:hypothetical protein
MRCGLMSKKPVEQPRDLGIRAGDKIAIAWQRLQLAFLALQAFAERVADTACGVAAGRQG